MARNAIYNVCLNTLTIRTTFPRVSLRNDPCTTVTDSQMMRALTFGDHLKVRFAVDLDACLLDTRASDSHLLRISWLRDGHQVRTLGSVLLSELDGDLVLTFNTRHVDARVGH